MDARRTTAGEMKDWLAAHNIQAPWSAVAATVFLLAFHCRALDCWFYQDDFGWLHVWPPRDFHHLLWILFAPHAHSNLRLWSENLYFLSITGLFGLHALPFHIVVFSTAILNLFLLDRLVRLLTGSAWAALAAEICWLANPAAAPAFCWTCIYNQTLCMFFVLLALVLFARGRYWAQVAVFVLGLGALETVVMYPVLASLYAILYDREKLRRTFPLYGVSLVYTIFHFIVAPAPSSGPYKIALDGRIFLTLARYIDNVLGPEHLSHFHWTWPVWFRIAATALLCAALLLAGFCARRAGLFGAGWFLAMLAPLLVLPDHVMDYLLTVPAVGLAIILGAALARRPRLAAAPIAMYLAVALPAAWETEGWHHARSLVSENLVEGVVEFARAHPGKTLLLTGMSTDQFNAGFRDLPFDLYGLENVFLAPGADRAIDSSIAHLYALPVEKAQPLIDSGQAMMLDVSDPDAAPRLVRYPLPRTTEPGSVAPVR